MKELFKDAEKVGVRDTENFPTYFQIDSDVLFSRGEKNVEIMPIDEAVKKYGLREYLWKNIPKNKDRYTKIADENPTKGYFIRIKKGSNITAPIQSCLMMENIDSQNVHNIIIAEENSSAQILTGCTTRKSYCGRHIGISEFYVGKNAKLVFTMIHSWADEFIVRPRSKIIVEENGTFISNYINFEKVKDLQMYPSATLKNGAVGKMNTIIFADNGSIFDVGSELILNKNSKGEISSKVVAKDGNVVARGRIVGLSASFGHQECRGMLLSKNGAISSIPELIAKSELAELSHEAAIGRVREEALWYLMSRGFAEDEAISLIVRGFLDPELPELPEILKEELRKILDTAIKGL